MNIRDLDEVAGSLFSKHCLHLVFMLAHGWPSGKAEVLERQGDAKSSSLEVGED